MGIALIVTPTLLSYAANEAGPSNACPVGCVRDVSAFKPNSISQVQGDKKINGMSHSQVCVGAFPR